MLNLLLMQGLVFYITPGVIPPAEELKKVIESAGGAVLKRRPSAKTTTKMRDDKVCYAMRCIRIWCKSILI